MFSTYCFGQKLISITWEKLIFLIPGKTSTFGNLKLYINLSKKKKKTVDTYNLYSKQKKKKNLT